MTAKLVLKENLVFMVSHTDGDVPYHDQEGLGIYYKDTRYLSILEMKVSGETPVLLTSSCEFNFMGNIQSANPLMRIPAETPGETITLLPRTISIRRNRFIEDGLHERVGFYNYNSFPVRLVLNLRFGSDFRDMFDVRGYNRAKRGEIQEPLWDGKRLRFSYAGLDGQERYTYIVFDHTPDEIIPVTGLNSSTHEVLAQRASLPDSTSASAMPTVHPAAADAVFVLTLKPFTPLAVTYHVIPQGLGNGQNALAHSFDMGARRMKVAYESWFEEATVISTDNEVFNAFLQRSIYDLRILMEELPTGLFPVAGIPWFAVPFGRDSIITSLQTLIFDPQIAVGTLRFLAQHQGKVVNDWNEEEPGKILHEMRAGEMTLLHEMPHIPYFGAVDSTPLFLMLFAATMCWLDSDSLYRELLPNVKAALDWIDNYGDRDGDGFIEYDCHNERGVKNQGWKDSAISLLMADGSLPKQPIALVEAQGYVYAAKIGVAEVLERKGEHEWAARLRREAETLKQRFNEVFWMPEAQFFAQALDRDKKQISSITSNPAHCLWCGLVADDKVEAVVKKLTAEDMSSGWGLRTLSSNAPSFNPMSYHNGSVWPHDNSLAAAGLKRVRHNEEAISIISQIFNAAQRFTYFRLPELYCGFQQDTRYYSAPAEYPVSCSPQAWTAGAALLFLQTMLGLEVNATLRRVILRPYFPPYIDWVELKGLNIGNQPVSLRVSRRDQHRYQLEILDNERDIEVVLMSR
ncbi:MAG: amylo-alpha-1,6-glucosidase [Chloroflexi bacterium]|uniref:Amylo-alpha-1,6-glucosidase n=1 Tax=Candidatus Chlorohelix allophototropha TaxID=3003348 RepID=A0A8T7M2N1_9CHLR|nr:amylo-alpha-1,6-glucosidase [Chloroflexota bacterium]WJW66620.1 amylo-alpha-1,6-glucosidase [Chloroflexota bacterium L227-S17]